MLTDLDETLKQLLVQKAGLDPAEVDISFDIPTRDWSAGSAAARPTVNLYLYDIRENRELRETYWDQQMNGNGTVTLKRNPVRVDVSYMITCWTSTTEDQHQLLWHVLETFFRHSPLPDDILQGGLRDLIYPIRTEVAQPDGILKNLSDFWGALENSLRPAINLVLTLELDLQQLRTAPLVFARVLKFGRQAVYHDAEGVEYRLQGLAEGWETAPIRFAGVVHDADGNPVPDVSARIIALQDDGRPIQVGPTIQTGFDGRYVFASIPPGDYTLVIEAPGQAPQQHPLKLAAGEGSEPLHEFVHHVEVSMKKM
jgi:hypothetical protein